MERTLAASNARASDIDAREETERERRRRDAKRLKGACATVGQVAAAPSAPVAGVSAFAARVLGLVVDAVRQGFAGACLSARDIGQALASLERPRGYSERWVFFALVELRDAGALRVTHDYVPVAETQLEGWALEQYTAAGYTNSQTKNLYRLGWAARDLNPRVACGKLRGQLAEASQFIANCSQQYSDSGSGSGLCADPLTVRPCEIVDNRGLEQLPEPEGEKQERGLPAAAGCPEAPLARRAEAGEGIRANPAPAESVASADGRPVVSGCVACRPWRACPAHSEQAAAPIERDPNHWRGAYTPTLEATTPAVMYCREVDDEQHVELYTDEERHA